MLNRSISLSTLLTYCLAKKHVSNYHFFTVLLVRIKHPYFLIFWKRTGFSEWNFSKIEYVSVWRRCSKFCMRTFEQTWLWPWWATLQTVSEIKKQRIKKFTTLPRCIAATHISLCLLGRVGVGERLPSVYPSFTWTLRIENSCRLFSNLLDFSGFKTFKWLSIFVKSMLNKLKCLKLRNGCRKCKTICFYNV